MGIEPARGARLRFGGFELDPWTAELLGDGEPVKLPLQAARLLALLASHSGELITREEAQHHIWGGEPLVDAELGLNTCIRQIRAALGDDADAPRFVATLPRRGYRFVAPVEVVEPNPVRAAGSRVASHRRVLVVATAIIAATAIVSAALWAVRDRGLPWRPRRTVVAVLPFANLTGDRALDYLADGLTEELIGRIGRLHPRRLAVIARTSVMTLKSHPVGVDVIGRRLGAELLVEGSVRASGGRLLVGTRLVRARDHVQLWSSDLEATADDPVQLQTEVSGAVADGLSEAIGIAAAGGRAQVGTAHRQAYEAYLKGRHLLRMLGRDEAERAIELFEQAIAADPSYAGPHLGLANSYYALSNMRVRPEAAMAKAREAVTRALALDPALPGGHTALALIHAFYDWDWTGAERLFRRALEVDPMDAEAHAWYGLFLSLMGRLQAAERVLEQGRRLDPLSPAVLSLRGMPAYLAGRHQESLRWGREALELTPGYFQAQAAIGTTYEAMGDYPRAVAELERAYRLEDSPVLLAFLTRARALAGDREAAEAGLRELLALREATFVSGYDVALVYDGLGDRERALDWLEQAFSERAEGLAGLRVDPRLARLRGDPRFAALVAKMRFP